MAHVSIYKDAQGACITIITPGFSPGNLVAHSAFEGINSCRVPIYILHLGRETIVHEMPCLRTPSGFRTLDPLITSREHGPLRTPQCSHSVIPVSYLTGPNCRK